MRTGRIGSNQAAGLRPGTTCMGAVEPVVVSCLRSLACGVTCGLLLLLLLWYYLWRRPEQGALPFSRRREQGALPF
jgi:hypothetical protein